MSAAPREASIQWARKCFLIACTLISFPLSSAASAFQDATSGEPLLGTQSVLLLVLATVAALFVMFTVRHLSSLIGIPKEDNYGRFAEFFGNATVGVSIVDKDMRIVRTNGPFEELTGFSKLELQGMPCTDLVVEPAEDDDASVVAGMIDQFGDSHQLFVQRKDGSRFHARFVVMPAPKGIERDGSIIMLEEGLSHTRLSAPEREARQRTSI